MKQYLIQFQSDFFYWSNEEQDTVNAKEGECVIVDEITMFKVLQSANNNKKPVSVYAITLMCEIL